MSIREIINVGSRVEGVNEAIKGWVGTVKAIEGEALAKRFFIEWRSNDLDRSNPPQDGKQYSKYPKRAFKLFVPRGGHSAAVRARPANQRDRRPPRRFDDDQAEVSPPENMDSDPGSIQHPSSSDDDVETGDDEVEEEGDGEHAAEAVGAAAEGVPPAHPAIVQLCRWDQGYLLSLEKKVRGIVVDKVDWRCVNSIPVNLHTSVYEGVTRLNWNVTGMADSDEKREYDYWALATSDDALREEVVHTNANIAMWNDAQAASGAAHVPCARCSIGEIIRKKGLRLAMSLQPGHPTAWYWQSESGDSSTLRAPSFGARFGMSRNRFFALEQHEQFCAKPADAGADPWWRVRALVTWFNQRRAAVVKAGKFLCEDESGSWWYGRDAERLPDWMADMACPHVTFMKKKPHPKFIELKNICDVMTGIMLCLEIQEGTMPMRAKAFVAQFPSHIATSLRLLQTCGYLHTWRVLIADAAFGSVSACKALLQHGMLSMMIVKQAYTMYPLKQIRNWANTKDPKRNEQDKGSTLIYTATVRVPPRAHGEEPSEHRIAAVGYMHQNVRTIVTSYGNCLAGAPVIEERKALQAVPGSDEHDIVTERKEIPCPSNVSDMIAGFGAIDQHNKLRQGLLRMEYQKKTIHWWKRLATTIDGMNCTDAYKMMCYDMHRRGEEPPDFLSFCDKLAHQLIFNIHMQERRLRPRDEEGNSEQEHVLASATDFGRGWMKPNGQVQDIRGYCKLCRSKTSFYCTKCSTITGEQTSRKGIVFICNPTKQRCFYHHCNDPTANATPQVPGSPAAAAAAGEAP
jgi:hypothetical protein